MLALKLITAPLTEPVTAAEVKLHTRISYSQEDALINTWIKSGRKLAEDYQRRAYVNQQWELTLDGFPSLPLDLPRPPLLSISSISYFDTDDTETIMYSDDTDQSTTTTTMGPTTSTTTTAEPNVIEDDGTFIIDTDSEPGRLCFAYSKRWPTTVLRPHNAFKIRYWAGCGPTASTVPQTVKDAIMLYCAYRNENRSGEITEAPRQFFDLLRPERIFTP
jgi:hypothetical protein